MANIMKNILKKITPWYDDDEAEKREQGSRHEITKSQATQERADRVISDYILVDTVYQRRKTVHR